MECASRLCAYRLAMQRVVRYNPGRNAKGRICLWAESVQRSAQKKKQEKQARVPPPATQSRSTPFQLQFNPPSHTHINNLNVPTTTPPTHSLDRIDRPSWPMATRRPLYGTRRRKKRGRRQQRAWLHPRGLVSGWVYVCMMVTETEMMNRSTNRSIARGHVKPSHHTPRPSHAPPLHTRVMAGALNDSYDPCSRRG